MFDLYIILVFFLLKHATSSISLPKRKTETEKSGEEKLYYYFLSPCERLIEQPVAKLVVGFS